MTAYEQRSYPGAAADTLLNADIASNALTFSVSPGTGNGYPTGGSGPFFIAIDYDTSKAEKIRVTSRINDTFTIASVGDRGVDGTSAVAHSANAKVRAVWTATDAQEANRAAANTVGKVTTKGDLLAGTGANALARVPVGGNGNPLVGDSTQAAGVAFRSGVSIDSSGYVVGPNDVKTTTWPTCFWLIAGTTSPAGGGTTFDFYKRIGDLVFAYTAFQFSAGQAIGGGDMQVNYLPAGPGSSTGLVLGKWGHWRSGVPLVFGDAWAVNSGTPSVHLVGTKDLVMQVGDFLQVQVTYLAGTSG